MKKVVSTQQVAHIWANQLQTEARTPQNNFYFKDETIYSYGTHFPIAKHETNKKGTKVILFTTRSYSNTTGKHISIVQSASRHIEKIYVNHVNFSPRDNFEKIEEEVKPLIEKILRARQPLSIINKVEREKANAQKYADFTGTKMPKTLQKLFSFIDSKEVKEHIEKRAERNAEIEKNREAKELQKQEENRLKQAENLEKWRNFNFQGYFHGLGKDFLRYNTEKQRIETSQGVKIPIIIAKKFYFELIDKLNAGGCLTCDSLQVMEYTVREVNVNYVKIGCHKIDWSEINNLAKKLNWI